MLSNPPYGKSWKTDLERMGGKKDLKDARFLVQHGGDPEFSLTTRSSDGQLMFLVNMLSKMKHDTPLGSRIAEVHNGSSLFTGDAGQGESNIRRWIIENDWLEAIIALPLNMFYNTGIATYIWVLTNRKPDAPSGQGPAHRRHRMVRTPPQEPGQEELPAHRRPHPGHLRHFPGLDETDQSKVFPNEAFGFWKVTVERPLAGHAGSSPTASTPPKEIKAFKADGLVDDVAPPGHQEDPQDGHPADPLHGLFEIKIGGKTQVVEYEPDSDLRDTEQVPLLEEGGIEAFFRREVLPSCPRRLDRRGKPPRSATRSPSPGTSTSPRSSGRSLRSGPISRPWRSRPKGLLEQILVDVE